MQTKRIVQWGILAALAVASALNVLYLTGVLGQHASTVGFLLVLACFAAQMALKNRWADEPAENPGTVQTLRSVATVAFAVIWLVSTGMAFVWVK